VKHRIFSLLATALVALTMAVAAPGVAQAGTSGVEAVAADPTPEEQDALRSVAAAIWTQQLADGWNMNNDVADVLSTATDSILQCSAAFSLVPKPPGFVPGLAYLVQYARNLVDYFRAVQGNRTYRVCVVNAARNYRTAIELASAGI
jgi:hypothetical protein